MIAGLHPHPDQLLWYLKSALNGFETLPPDEAIANARADAVALLAYLDRTENSILITGVEAIEPDIWHERGIRNPNVTDIG